MEKLLPSSASLEVIELYRLTRALLSLRDMFDGAYERAVLSMLPEPTKARFDFIARNVSTQAASAMARPIIDDSYVALDNLLDEYKHDVAESLLATALADTVAGLPEKLTSIEQSLQIR
ncbi:hypothetical protein [Methylosinus sp. Sm6]|uniref:hypothetical protein n=1 Tax=Methylosinus sp. Sm6 TaxID=2866948 RepID=UPI001C9A09E8|nr:hypothetical protein [Methylosinus sp. Sm6]MBY6241994.1 hypothetical protein [Methylosinus sp. Sm6]